MWKRNHKFDIVLALIAAVLLAAGIQGTGIATA